jgi:diadenosine tetraphosphatase ApaH/serine/threonine PP2A family protein phosphatase
VIRKFFPHDKNYLLENAQLSLQDELLTGLIEKVKAHYLHMHNPLGLNDTFTSRIVNHTPWNLKPLYGFYQNLAAVYRFKFGNNQLEIVWDGRDHQEKYKAEWTACFTAWTGEFCRYELFLQAALDLTVFLPENRHADLAECRMNHFILKHFDVKIHRSRGIVNMKVA